jgi:hypothetical protein
MALPLWLNPNQPLPPVLASPLCPPPHWPNTHWVSLPVVQLDFPEGPYNHTTGCCNGDYSGPIGTGLWPGPSFCPGSGLGGVPPDDDIGDTSIELRKEARDLRRAGRRYEESLERQVEQRRRVMRDDREIDREGKIRREARLEGESVRQERREHYDIDRDDDDR